MADITKRQVITMFKYIMSVHNRVSKFGTSDKGECWSLPYNALQAAGASLPCLTCGESAKYIWGRAIMQAEATSGDVIQIEGKLQLLAQNRHMHHFKHHSMIIIDKKGLGIKVAQQWVSKKVHYQTYNLWRKSGIGVMNYYRPQQALK